VQALVGHIEPRLPARGEEKKADEEGDEQNRRQRDIPTPDSGQFLAQDFHVKLPALRGPQV
jgi:hypothetical protein